ncbi:propionyl-coenzyme A carboxylase alpha polypeptide [Mesorhizobium sp. B2-6-2]|nr:propionyl-coenzyme A carboxylase alpha polypeptide [Mesorhizobium sp. B2-6-2]
MPDISPSWGEISSFTDSAFGDWRNPSRHLISPLEGEMAGRPEGGATGRGLDRYHEDHPHELG